MQNKIKIGVIGLGYVGLPLAFEFAKKFEVIGYDINELRITELNKYFDNTQELSTEELSEAKLLTFTSDIKPLKDCNIYIITVPTPVDQANEPDLSYIVKASALVGSLLKQGDTVVYESTVFPGATREYCIPVLETKSGLCLNENFGVGYSPERINPGDKDNRLTSIKKLVSGSSSQTTDLLSTIYGSIIKAGIHKCSSLEVAEAAKVIENTQRDINIALMNELSLLLSELNVDTIEVLEAAGTKWNFLNFRPGLVGGHCIGVDPYYLIHKAKTVNFHTQIIGAGRRVNDQMPVQLGRKFIKKLSWEGVTLSGAKILVLGLTFKENCPDLRNSKVFDLISELTSYGCDVSVYDPLITPQIGQEVNFEILLSLDPRDYNGIILAVPHKEFSIMSSADIRALSTVETIFMDIKAMYSKFDSDIRA
jgi:UDP-N-acetyl-D-glucosamine/UDP-N-acetyl-D-galactosamine dehydrogenase